MAYPIPRILDVDGRNIRIAHLDTPEAPKTALTAALSATGTTLTVLDNTGFAQNQFVRIGRYGSETSEIVRISGAVTRGTSLTTIASVFAHPIGAEVTRLQFNQWRIYGNSTNATAGATLVATIDIQADAPFTTYLNTGTEYAFYFVIGYDSNAAAEFTYSDGVASATGYADNTVGSLIQAALENAKAERTSIITDKWFIREINDCLRFITGKLKKWSYLENFDYVLGQTARGSFSFAMPSDAEDRNSNKSVLGFRIGGQQNLTWADKREIEEEMETALRTQVRTEASANDTTLAIDNSYDFADSGTVTVFVSGTKYDITYTGVTRSATAGVLTGVPASGTGSISVTIPVDTNVWQDMEEGKPSVYSIWDGNLYIWPLADGSYDNLNAYLDYFTVRTAVNSAGDAIEGPRYDAVKHWLIAKLRAQSNAMGEMNPADADWQIFREILADLIRRETTSQKFKMKPKTNTISYKGLS